VLGSKNNERIKEYHKAVGLNWAGDDISWCASFVAFCIKNCGLPLPESPQAARSWLKWGTAITIPAFGCVAVFKRGNNPAEGHIGFFLGFEGNDIILLSGNYGNKVAVGKSPKKDILGYRWI